jgi:hypothetical protein
MLNVGEGRTGLWIRFEYEFLPNFCYTCGMLDHIDRDCKIKLAKGEKAQFGNWLKAYIPRQSLMQNRGVWEGERSSNGGSSSGNTRRYGFTNQIGRSDSDNDGWRKKDVYSLHIRDAGKLCEVTNPQKINEEKGKVGVEESAARHLFP